MKIGDFARLGQVSVRMLRHYDAVGLLRPARVDPSSGYRDYAPDQLARLHRIVALKDLGLTLDQVDRILADSLDATQLRGMLRLRRSELAAQVEQARTALASVEHRLRLIERELTMPDVEYVTKALPTRRVAGLSVVVTEDQSVSQVVGPLFARAEKALSGSGAAPGVAVYDLAEDGMRILCAFGFDGERTPGAEVVDLPAVQTAVCAVHLGSMDGIAQSWTELHTWLTTHGLEPSGPCREVYLEATAADQSGWVTELQQPVRPVPAPAG